MINLQETGRRAEEAKKILAKCSTGQKNEALRACADALERDAAIIIRENAKDMEKGRAKGMSAGLLDRLLLNEARIAGMADGLRQVAALPDPIGEVVRMSTRPNGLIVGQKRVPLGVVGMIYEARPNVTPDAFGLCFKTGNAVILKGGSDALCSNIAIVDSLWSGLEKCGLPKDALQLITDTDRQTAVELMRLNEYLDVLIPRGGAGLIRTVVQNSTVPVIETGVGNCHIYVDEPADFAMAENIIIIAKTQRVGVCNACESLVVHSAVLEKLLPSLTEKLSAFSVEMRCDERALAFVKGGVPATEEDWGTEYLDYILSVKTVDSFDEAVAHINRYNTGHSEAIITESYTNAQRFLEEIDAACVYVNASTRFTDGNEFGLGAEIGISTQKLHARGPMGLEALTTTKHIIYGSGQVRQ